MSEIKILDILWQQAILIPSRDDPDSLGFSGPIAHSASAAGRVSMSRRLGIRRFMEPTRIFFLNECWTKPQGRQYLASSWPTGLYSLITEYTTSVGRQSKKATPGLHPGPAKGRRPLETIYFRSSNNHERDRVRAPGDGQFGSVIEAQGAQHGVAARSTFHLTQEPPNDDEPSPTHDRGHADTQPLTSDAEFLRSASFHVRPAFRQIPGGPGASKTSVTISFI